MERHAIESIMNATMENIRDMVDVNTVVGEPVTANDGTTIIPISRVSFGFVAGGGEYELSGGKKPPQPSGNGNSQSNQNGHAQSQAQEEQLPFAGGAGAGVSVSPVGFLVVNGEQVRLLPAQPYGPLDRAIELAPQLVGDIKRWLSKSNRPVMNQTAQQAVAPATGPLD